MYWGLRIFQQYRPCQWLHIVSSHDWALRTYHHVPVTDSGGGELSLRSLSSHHKQRLTFLAPARSQLTPAWKPDRPWHKFLGELNCYPLIISCPLSCTTPTLNSSINMLGSWVGYKAAGGIQYKCDTRLNCHFLESCYRSSSMNC